MRRRLIRFYVIMTQRSRLSAGPIDDVSHGDDIYAIEWLPLKPVFLRSPPSPRRGLPSRWEPLSGAAGMDLQPSVGHLRRRTLQKINLWSFRSTSPSINNVNVHIHTTNTTRANPPTKCRRRPYVCARRKFHASLCKFRHV